MFKIVFVDMLNQRVIGGNYTSFTMAILTARNIVENGFKSSFQVIRTIDNVVLAQSKA
jgi:hypothetical protein